MLKVIEILAESNKSWEDAAQTAVAQANKTLRNDPVDEIMRITDGDNWADQYSQHGFGGSLFKHACVFP